MPNDETTQTVQPSPEPTGLQVDSGRVIASLTQQVASQALEIAKRDAIAEQIQAGAIQEIQSLNAVIVAQQEEITRLKALVPEDVPAESNGHVPTEEEQVPGV